MGFAGIRAVFFDCGNTLLHLDYPFVARLLAEHRCATTPQGIRLAEYAARAAIDRELARARRSDAGTRAPYFGTVLARLKVPPARRGPIIAALEAHNRERCLWRVAEPDTPAVLAALRARGFLLGVISNADGRVEEDLERYGLGAFLATVVDSHVVGIEKPDAAIFRHAVERLGARPEDAVHVGDVFGIDVVGARRAGLTPVLLDRLGRYPGRVDCPRIRRLGGLLRLLPERAGARIR